MKPVPAPAFFCVFATRHQRALEFVKLTAISRALAVSVSFLVILALLNYWASQALAMRVRDAPTLASHSADTSAALALSLGRP